jgi:hypothetical protein
MSTTPTIIGAGLAGLIAAHAWPQAPLVEASPQPRAAHRALLRFRSDAVSRLTGVEFRKVMVRKGIWAEGRFQEPNIRWANLYAQKVLGHGQLKGERSIWKTEPVERFVAPDTLYEQLLESVNDRVTWNQNADFCRHDLLVSTAPMPVALATAGIRDEELQFHRSAIKVYRFRVPGADVFQTVYFPERHLEVYRASITGDTLIVETTANASYDIESEQAVNDAFGLHWEQAEMIEQVEQKYGKIAPIDDSLRKQLLFKLTHDHNIYSLGRFATWRNILLDDVVDDIAAIKRLLKANSAYDVRKAAS